MSDLEVLQRLAIGLAVGLVIGFERGWHVRQAPEGTRVAGIRTFAFIGVTGALVALLGAASLPLVAATIAVGVVALMLTSRWITRADSDVGATTETASLTTFALGTLAGIGYLAPAIAGAVVSALLLGSKGVLHRWLERINEKELFAALQLLLISAVVLPFLPDEALGPLGAINPYRLWWMVVLTAGLSFAGYVILRLFEARRAMLLAGFAGGLIASTATTFALARKAKSSGSGLEDAIAAGITTATLAMLLRTYILACVMYPPFWPDLMGPLGAMAIVVGIASAWFVRHAPQSATDAKVEAPRNPLDLRAALGFACTLAVVLLLVEAGRSRFGAAGVYVLSALGGLGDVDAVTLSVAQQAQQLLPQDVATAALLIAALVNTAVKIAIVIALSPAAVARRVGVALGAAIAVGSGATVLLQ